MASADSPACMRICRADTLRTMSWLSQVPISTCPARLCVLRWASMAESTRKNETRCVRQCGGALLDRCCAGKRGAGIQCLVRLAALLQKLGR